METRFIERQTEFELPFDVHVLPHRSPEPLFSRERLSLDPLRDTAVSIKERLRLRGLVICNAQIVPDGEVLKNWFTEGSAIVVAACSPDFEEADEWAANPNQMARLLRAGLNHACALVCLSRAFLQVGFAQFSDAATFLRHVVDSTGTHDYQRRIDLVCLSHPAKELQHVAPFNEKSGTLMLPPTLRGEIRGVPPLSAPGATSGNDADTDAGSGSSGALLSAGGFVVDEWVDAARDSLSVEERAKLRATAQRMRALAPHLTAASRAVVRVFGYHPVASPRHSATDGGGGGGGAGGGGGGAGRNAALRAIPFTAFFISPRHILTTRSARYSAEHDTYATRFAFTREVRALHGMLQPGITIFECREVPSVVDFLASSIRGIGVVLEGNKVLPELQAGPWNDLLLLEVCDPRHYSSDTQYLLPELSSSRVRKDDELFALHYAAQPSAAYIADVFGARGHNRPDEEMEALLRRQFWQYDCKACSVGAALADADELRRVRHSCTMLSGTRGAPLLRQVHVDFENDAAKLKRMGEPYEVGLETCGVFVGLSTGRAYDLFDQERTNIISMSTSDLARVESLAINMYNEAITCDHIGLILLYFRFVRDAITNSDHRLHIQQYLQPHEVLVSQELLATCHRKMLKDADDYNEYGMDFYEHHDLDAALAAFREGARMFSTASIPNLSEYEIELKNALQTNVSSVVVAKLK